MIDPCKSHRFGGRVRGVVHLRYGAFPERVIFLRKLVAILEGIVEQTPDRNACKRHLTTPRAPNYGRWEAKARGGRYC
jgi:hypothetical protein